MNPDRRRCLAGLGVLMLPTGAPTPAKATPRFVHFRTGDRNVKDLMIDGDILWVATSGGLIRYDTTNESYTLIDNRSGLLSNGIFHVGRVQDRVTVGTYGGGMAMLDPAGDKWRNYNVPEGLGDAFVYDVLQAGNGDLWIATWSGANQVVGGALDDPSRWRLHTVYNTDNGLPNDWVYGLAEGADGTIWLATEGGLARFAGGQWQHWNHSHGLGAPYELVRDSIAFKSDPAKVSRHHGLQKAEMGLDDVDVAFNPNYIVALVVDQAQTVWAGTWGGGLARFDGTQWRNFTTRDGLPGNHVFMLHVDGRGELWIGTNKGLARRTGDGFEVLGVADGLFGDVVFSMASDGGDSLWVGSYGGVARLQRRPA